MRNFAKMAIIAAAVGFTACGNATEPPEYDQQEQSEQYGTAANHATEPISTEEQASQPTEPNAPTHPAEPPQMAIPTAVVPFTVNGTADFELTAFLAYENATPHFLLQDIAKMLDGTQAQFDFARWGMGNRSFRVFRGQNFTQNDSTAVLEEFGETTIWLYFPIGAADIISDTFSAISTPQGVAVDIADLEGFFGFSIERETANAATIRINTHESPISTEGRIAVSEFLRRRPTLFIDRFDWTDEILAITPSVNMSETWTWSADAPLLYPVSFRLYDLNNNGIPDIIIRYDAPPWATFRALFVYSYINGEYVQVEIIGEWYEFTRDLDGRIVHFGGNHHNGFDTINQVIFRENEVVFEPLGVSPFLRHQVEDTTEEWSTWWEEITEEWDSIWAEFDLLESRLLSIRPLSLLQAELTEYFSEIFSRNFWEFENFIQPQAWQSAYLDILHHYMIQFTGENRFGTRGVHGYFVLHDIDGDGEKELIIAERYTHGEFGLVLVGVYAFANGELQAFDIRDFDEFFITDIRIPANDTGFVLVGHGGDNSTLHWIEIENGNLQVRVHTWFGIANEFGDLFFYLDGEESNENEILAIFGLRDEENWTHILGREHLLTQENVYTAIFGGR